LPLNHQLTERGGTLEQITTTAPCYRLYALPGGPPLRPGLVRVATGGATIAVEVWRLPLATIGSFLAGIGPPLAIGSVLLADGSSANGFVCEGIGIEGAEDVTVYGGWRAMLSARQGR
jgi:allophanate hydrolase